MHVHDGVDDVDDVDGVSCACTLTISMLLDSLQAIPVPIGRR